MIHLPTPELRDDVHAVLDQIWISAVEAGGYQGKQLEYLRRSGYAARKAARERVYAWLAEQMWLTTDECHVARFSFDQCMEAICLLRGATYVEIRAWAKRREVQRAYTDYVERRAAT